MSKVTYKRSIPQPLGNDLKAVIPISLPVDKNLFYEVSVAFYWIDKEGYCLGCNKEELKILGLTSEEQFIGKHSTQLFTKDAWINSRKVIIEGKSHVFEEKCKDGDGKVIHFLSIKHPLFNKQDQVIGLLGVSFDITNRKEAEKQILLAKEAAEAANQAKTEFLENMRHDIRTALNGIRGFGELIYEEATEPKVKEYAEHLFTSCKALSQVLNQILHASRVFGEELPLYKKKFRLADKLKEIIQLSLAKACEKKLELSLEYDPAIPEYLLGDSQRIAHIVLELVANALKYTEKGKVVVQARLSQREGRNIVVQLTVSDTGIGIPADKQEEIFTRFKRLTPAYEGRYKGLGLGLSVVKQFIDDLDGEIHLASAPQQGTTFTCYLPLKVALSEGEIGVDTSDEVSALALELGLVEKPVQSNPPVELSVTDERPLSRILVVEDQPIAVHVAQSILARLDCQVDVAMTGSEALQKVQQNRYDLIFMDVGLPDMDGNAVTRYIRILERDSDHHTPIVALTAHIDAENKQRCVERGMDAILNKPLVKERAADILNAFIPSRSRKMTTFTTQTAKQPVDFFTLAGAVIDLAKGAELVSADEDTAKEMIERMLQNIEEEMPVLTAAHAQKDWRTIEHSIHKLRGGIAYCGTPRLMQAADYLEEHLKSGATELAEKLYQQFLTEIEAVKQQAQR